MKHSIKLSYGNVELRPLAASDGCTLQPHITPELWAGMSTPVPATPQDFADQFAAIIDSPNTRAFGVWLSDQLVGRTCFYDMVLPLRTEVGQTFYLPQCQGTQVNPACKLLMLGYAFEEFKVQRVGIRCDVRNKRSAAAIEKLGAVYEGVQRAWRRDPVGNVVDTAIYSITATEWPAVREKLETRLAAAE